MIEQFDELHEVRMRCLKSGCFVDWRMTAARDGTFVDAEFGMNPTGLQFRLFDATMGRRYFRSWLEQSVEALGEAARQAPAPAER
jgi:hypothetical protein